MEGITERIRNAACTADILNAREDYLRLYSEYHTMSALAYMRYSVNTADEFYSAENDYYDEAGPAVHSLIADYAAALLDSPFRAELERELSPLLFRSMELQRKAISPVIVDDMVEENRLISEYSKLMAGMEFDFRGCRAPRCWAISRTVTALPAARLWSASERRLRKTARSLTGYSTRSSMCATVWQRSSAMITSSGWATAA